MEKSKDENLFYVEIPEPVAVRRETLLSTRNAIQFLKKNEELKDIRIQKIEKIMEYKNDIKEINVLINRLKEKLPKAKLRIKKDIPVVSQVKKEKKKTGEKKERKKETSELDKLESELGQIERKLGRLR